VTVKTELLIGPNVLRVHYVGVDRVPVSRDGPSIVPAGNEPVVLGQPLSVARNFTGGSRLTNEPLTRCWSSIASVPFAIVPEQLA